jgi:hypothetical protein
VFLICALNGAAAEPRNPNHLEPVGDPKILWGYDQVVFDILVGKPAPELCMVCVPSFHPEYALILRLAPLRARRSNGPSPGNSNQWILESATATKQIWHFKENAPNYSGKIELDLRKDVAVERNRIAIDESLAVELKRAWQAALRLTRPAEEQYAGADGVTYRFYSGGSSGEIWTPEIGIPADLANLSEQLIKLTSTPPENRQVLFKKCAALAKKIEREANNAHDKL